MENEKIFEHLLKIENQLTKITTITETAQDRLVNLEARVVKIERLSSFMEIGFKIVVTVGIVSTIWHNLT